MRSSIYFILISFFALSSCQSDSDSQTNSTTPPSRVIESKSAPSELPKSSDEVATKTPSKEVEAKAVSVAQKAKKKTKEAPASTQQTQHTSVKEAKPILQFSRINHKWTDSITSGDVINHTFEFQNGGNANLVIQSVNATCGCTRPSYPFIPLAPGEKGEIKMQYNSLGKTGWQRPTLTVNSNEPAGIKRVYLDVYVKPKKKKKGKDSLKTSKPKLDSLKK